jgi:nucleotide-binding universal stress UspA family protein
MTMSRDPSALEIRKILCPVDTSSFSQRALRHAVALGAWYDAEVVVLAVRPTVLPPALWLTREVAVPLEDTSEAGAVASLAAFVHCVVGPNHARLQVADGHVVPEILRAASELPADLIVMGTHGLTGFDRLVLGSVTQKVLRKAGCPVLTVPRLAERRPEPPQVRFRTIVCGVDRSAASRRAVGYALSLAQQAGGRLVLVHALEDFGEEEPRFASHFNTEACWREVEPEIRRSYEALISDETRQWCDVEVLTPRGKSYKQILAAAASREADLIVLGTAGWNAPFGTTTSHVLHEASCPVLVVPPLA